MHPWCVDCRQADPHGAKKAYDHSRFTGKYRAWSEQERQTWRQRVEAQKHRQYTEEELEQEARRHLADLVEQHKTEIVQKLKEQGMSQRQAYAVFKKMLK